MDLEYKIIVEGRQAEYMYIQYLVDIGHHISDGQDVLLIKDIYHMEGKATRLYCELVK